MRRKQNARRNEPGPEAGTGTNSAAGINLAGFESFDATYTDEPGTGATSAKPETGSDTGTGTGTGTGSAESTGKKRGRKPGSFNRQKTESVQDIDSLSTLLLSIHSMGAMLLKSPELEIDEQDAKKLAAAIERVRAHYPSNFNPKAMAWLNLGTTFAGVYGIQFMAIRNRIGRDKQKKVVQMPAPAPAQQPAPQQRQQAAAASSISVPSQFHPAAPVGDFD